MSYSFAQFSELIGQRLTLKKVRIEDLEHLAEALISPTTWFSASRKIDSIDKFKANFSKHLEKQARGETLALYAAYNGEIVALSLFQYPSEGFKRVEIGFTWIADKWQRTFVNSELKLLMLDYAFDQMRAHRVEFSVHPTNEKSNRSMQRLGAKLEGRLRKWRFLEGTDDGDRNIYSIIDDEWPQLREQLLEKLK